jgi:hypothetical protein
MSNSISTLLLRNLRDVFGENDPVRRRAAIDEIFHEDAVFYDPKGGIFRGRDEIDRIAGVIKATHPDFEYQPLFPPEELGDAGRVRGVSGTPGKPPAYAGTDFIGPLTPTKWLGIQHADPSPVCSPGARGLRRAEAGGMSCMETKQSILCL